MSTFSRGVARPFLCFLPVHAALAVAMQWLQHSAGANASLLALAAIHVAFPAVYLFGRVLGRFSFSELLALLALNHLVMWSVWLGLQAYGWPQN